MAVSEKHCIVKDVSFWWKDNTTPQSGSLGLAIWKKGTYILNVHWEPVIIQRKRTRQMHLQVLSRNTLPRHFGKISKKQQSIHAPIPSGWHNWTQMCCSNDHKTLWSITEFTTNQQYRCLSQPKLEKTGKVHKILLILCVLVTSLNLIFTNFPSTMLFVKMKLCWAHQLC